MRGLRVSTRSLALGVGCWLAAAALATIRVTKVEENVVIDDAKFARPR
jgi:hypothetical protein